MEAKNKYELLRQATGGFKQSTWIEETVQKQKEEGWRKNSQLVAIRILLTLRSKGMNQNELAKIMRVSPQQVSKWVKGSENLTFETVSRLEKALDISLMEIVNPSKKECKMVILMNKIRYGLMNVDSIVVETMAYADCV